jgi:glucosylceramidase
MKLHRLRFSPRTSTAPPDGGDTDGKSFPVSAAKRPLCPSVATLLLLSMSMACSGNVGSDPGGGPGPVPTGDPVEVYVTTPSASRLLGQDTDVRFRDGQASGVTVLAVDTATQYQEMVGFGASLTDASTWLIQTKLAPAARQSLIQELFGRNPGLGFSFTRLDMGASDFSRSHYSYDDVPAGETDPTLARFSIDADRAETIPVVKQALAVNPQLKVMASPWSAPAWMKTSKSLIKGSLDPAAYPAFAEYFRKFVRAYEAEGIPIYAITIQNEPHFEPDNYPGMRVTPESRAAFVGGHLGPLFQREGITTRILDWDHNWDEPGSPLAVLADPVARPYVSGVAWHCYAGNVSAQGPVHDAHPDKDAYFTECSGGEWSPKFAENLKWMTQNLIIGSTRNWAKGVLMWNMALDENHGPHLGGCGDCRGVVTIDSRTGAITRNVEYYVFGHASRFVHPGARRIASASGIDGVESVAFRNADDGSKAMIVLNTASVDRMVGVQVGTRWFRYTMPAGAVATFTW